MSDSFTGELIELLQKSPRTTVLTGAGISAESGVPTFREAQTGLWERYKPEELATPQAFNKNPRLVWEWYEWRRQIVSDSKPNPGHKSLVILERTLEKFSLITQNVDDLHHLAGSKNIIELHGNLFRFKCSTEGVIIKNLDAGTQKPPICPHCGSFVRPDVVWFGESLPNSKLHLAREAAENCDLFMSIGTSSVVQPAASLPLIALEHGARIVEINMRKTPLTPYVHYAIFGSAAKILPELVKKTWPQVDFNSELNEGSHL